MLNNKILLHTCCAPCSVGVVNYLNKNNIYPSFFWCNANIHPYKEYRLRKQTLEQYAKLINVKMFDCEGYDLKNFILNLDGEFSFGKRCYKCYLFRLSRCVKFAKQNKFQSFTTTLLISPFQNHSLIKQICEQLAFENGIEFKYFDFRPLFKHSQQEAKKLGFYLQNYCGCVFSEQERFYSPERKKIKKLSLI